MPRLTLKLQDRVLKEYAVAATTTIGRLPDNTVVIDDGAVSSHHACILREGDGFVVEDLQSTNGTFVNGVRVSRRVLKPGDVVQLGTHELELDQLLDCEPIASEEAGLAGASDGETIFVDRRTVLARLMQSETEARKYNALLARLKDVETHMTRSRATTSEGSAAPKVGVLRVVAGHADQDQYYLEAQTSLIGGGKSSLVRLRGWFKPNVAVAISRNRQGYVATVLGGDVLINNQRAGGRHELKDGDLVEVSGLTVEFRVEHEGRAPIPDSGIDASAATSTC